MYSLRYLKTNESGFTLEQILCEAASGRKVPVPVDIQEAPELRMDLLFYWDSFQKLSTSRFIGMSLGPIPWHIIQQCIQLNQIDNPEEFEYIIQGLDRAFLDYIDKISKKDQEDATTDHKDKDRHR